jgi:hypothetical protein
LCDDVRKARHAMTDTVKTVELQTGNINRLSGGI